MSALPRELLDWGVLAPLKLRARELTDGLYSGVHRSRRRGSGIEFDGHRDYVPGDDLRRLDYRALMRHGRLLVRQFETDTDRSLCVLLDGTLSMAFKSREGSAAKLAYAALLAAALGRVALATGDLISLDWLGGENPLALPPSGGREAFERLVVALEHAQPGGEERLDTGGFATTMQAVERRSRRGSIVLVLSDLLDLPEGAARKIASLAGRDRVVVVAQVLDPVEISFPFDGAVRLKPSAGSGVVETDAGPARKGYLAALQALQTEWQEALLAGGGRFLVINTQEKPAEAVRRLLLSIEGERQ